MSRLFCTLALFLLLLSLLSLGTFASRSYAQEFSGSAFSQCPSNEFTQENKPVQKAEVNKSPLTKIKRKNGEYVEGKLNGLLIQKSAVIQSLSTKRHLVAYLLINGKDVDAIDENGIHIGEGVKTLILAAAAKRQDQLPSDLDILEGLSKHKIFFRIVQIPQTDKMLLTEDPDFGAGSGFPIELKKGREAVSFYGLDSAKNREFGSPTLTLLGEVRVREKVVQISPFLEIETNDRVVTLPIEEIVDFKKP